MEGMASFTIGEEVLFEGLRYVISTAAAAAPYRFRLLASTPEGARIAWARPEDLEKMTRYTRPNDDTARY